MKHQGLVAGCYRLTVDTKNPNPDRRIKDDWTKLPLWKKDVTKLIAIQRTHYAAISEDDDEERPCYTYTELAAIGDRYTSLHNFKPWDDEYKLLTPSLERIEEPLDGLFTRLSVDSQCQYFFEWMVDSKRWTHSQIELLWQLYQERDDEP